jgi:hypothetical protein
LPLFIYIYIIVKKKRLSMRIGDSICPCIDTLAVPAYPVFDASKKGSICSVKGGIPVISPELQFKPKTLTGFDEGFVVGQPVLHTSLAGGV